MNCFWLGLRTVSALAGAMLFCALAGPALAQTQVPGSPQGVTDIYTSILKGEIIGVAIYGGTITFNNSPAVGSSSNEVKGFTDVLPGSYDGSLAGVQILYKRFNVNFAATSHTINVNKAADINQTPANPADDFFVNTAQRDSTQLAISWLYPPFSFGLGKESGTMTFRGPAGDHSISFDNSFAVFEFYIPFRFVKSWHPLIAVGYAQPVDFGTGSTHAQTFIDSATFAVFGLVF